MTTPNLRLVEGGSVPVNYAESIDASARIRTLTRAVTPPVHPHPERCDACGIEGNGLLSVGRLSYLHPRCHARILFRESAWLVVEATRLALTVRQAYPGSAMDLTALSCAMDAGWSALDEEA